MKIDIGKFGVWRRKGEISRELAATVEDLGYGAIWLGGSPPGDLSQVEEILDSTEAIPVVTGIVNMWREDAVTVGQSYLRLADRHPDRFVLGVGIGHPEATAEYRSPLDKIIDYLDRLEEVGVPPDGLILAALGPKVLSISADRTAGAHPYLTTPRHTRFARSVMGDDALLAPEQKVILETDVADARARGREAVARYLRLVNYRKNLLREGWEAQDLDERGSDRLVDELVLHGTVEEVTEGLQAHIDAGADHVCVQTLGPDPDSDYRELAGALLI